MRTFPQRCRQIMTASFAGPLGYGGVFVTEDLEKRASRRSGASKAAIEA